MLALGDTLEWWLGSAELMAGLGDLKVFSNVNSSTIQCDRWISEESQLTACRVFLFLKLSGFYRLNSPKNFTLHDCNLLLSRRSESLIPEGNWVIATGLSHTLWYTGVVCSLSWTQNHVSTYSPKHLFSPGDLCPLPQLRQPWELRRPAGTCFSQAHTNGKEAPWLYKQYWT